MLTHLPVPRWRWLRHCGFRPNEMSEGLSSHHLRRHYHGGACTGRLSGVMKPRPDCRRGQCSDVADAEPSWGRSAMPRRTPRRPVKMHSSVCAPSCAASAADADDLARKPSSLPGRISVVSIRPVFRLAVLHGWRKYRERKELAAALNPRTRALPPKTSSRPIPA